MNSAKATTKRARGSRARGLHLLLSAAALVGLVMMANVPVPSMEQVGETGQIASAFQGRQIVVQIVDVVSKAPIHGAFVRIPGVPRLVLTGVDGKASLVVPAGAKMLSIQASHPLYMATTQTRVDAGAGHTVRIAMPHLKKLAQADRLIRDPKTLDPQRQQRILPPYNGPRAVINQRHLPINTPINITYPLPANIKVKKLDGSIITLPLEEYLKGVLPKEIGTFFPAEAKKAQAVAARTYTIRYTQGGKNPICTTTQCQVWSPTHYASTTQAVLDTKGQVAVYIGSDASWKGKLAGGYFAASCGGTTLSSKAGGWSYRPFLQGVTCVENKGSACTKVCDISTCGGGRCSNSHSTCWGKFGHRIGLCQRGAQSMSKCGKTYVQIVKHYYTDVEIANLAVNPVDNAKLVRETIPSATKMRPGQSFTKEWLMENTGNTEWSASGGYSLARNDGTAFGAAVSVGLGSAKVASTKTHSFKINMTAPTKAGAYTARWQMAKSGKKFGQVVSISIIVEEPPPQCKDDDKDGFPAPGQGCPTPHDCNDSDKAINPGAKEICGNGKDDDCKDGDAKCPAECKDEDKDGYYAKNDKCPGPYDCDDTNKDVNPAAKEICGNGKDDDCKDGDLDCPNGCNDKDGDGYGAGSGCPEPKDCDDNDKDVYPGAPEICGNGKDEDCREGDLQCTKPPDRPKPPVTKKPMGANGCTRHSDCETNVCVEYNKQALCTVKCSAATTCPNGYECLQGQACWPKGTTPPKGKQCRSNLDCAKTETCTNGACVANPKKGCGCHAARGSSRGPAPEWLFWMFVALVGVWRVRRRSVRREDG